MLNKESKAAIELMIDNSIITRETAEKYFPELKEKESEDEKIRKELIHYFSDGVEFLSLCSFSREEIIAWLEKQGEPMEINPTEFDTRLQALIGKFDSLPKEELIGSLSFWLNVVQNDGTYKPDEEKQNEQKSDNKPKFHEGDWVVFNNRHDSVYQVEKIENYEYTLRHILGGSMPLSFSHEDMIRAWTIQDAKDGDMIACDEEILLFKSYSSVQGSFSLYCWYNGHTNKFHNKGVVDSVMSTRNRICPATKEQRYTLFDKIREAGYWWDAKKKKLEKVEQKPTNKVESKFNVGDWCRRRNGGFLRPIKITKVLPFSYEAVDDIGYHHSIGKDCMENNFYLWTIHDAKEGDVLISKGELKYSNGIKYERICLFNNLDKAFFTLVKTSNNIETYDIDVNIDYPDNTVPATIEQREILFMAMTDAGYTFDFEKKKLKKIEK